MIGTLFLWLCWPSFNAALVPATRQYLAVFNTFLCLTACTVMTFATSRLFRRAHHFTMEDIQNATLAGGVAMGASADILVSPGGFAFVFDFVFVFVFCLLIFVCLAQAALLVGSLAGTLSVFGFAILSPWLQRKLRIYDTCGVHNLHGMPSILGALVSTITCSQVWRCFLCLFLFVYTFDRSMYTELRLRRRCQKVRSSGVISWRPCA